MPLELMFWKFRTPPGLNPSNSSIKMERIYTIRSLLFGEWTIATQANDRQLILTLWRNYMRRGLFTINHYKLFVSSEVGEDILAFDSVDTISSSPAGFDNFEEFKKHFSEYTELYCDTNSLIEKE